MIPLAASKALKTKNSSSVASAFVPAHISGFFQPCGASTPERTGSRNCGPCLDLGVVTEVEVRRSERTIVKVFINGKRAPEAKTTLAAAKQILANVRGSFEIKVNHSCQVPVGSGYGASGAGALGTALALSTALRVRMSKPKLISAAHVAEVISYTGLGDVGAQARGGLVIGLEPGAPPYGKWGVIKVPTGTKVICATLGPILSKDFLSDSDFRKRARQFGEVALGKILNKPDIREFISVSRDFSENLGLMDDELRELAEAAEKAGAIGASQAMIGRSVFAFADDKKINFVKEAYLERLEPSSVMIAEVYGKRARALIKRKG